MTRFGSWQSHVDSWVNSPLAKNGNLLVVRYEDLRKDTETGLLEMLEFLGIPGDREVVRRAVENNSLRAMREKEDKAKNRARRWAREPYSENIASTAKMRASCAAGQWAAGARSLANRRSNWSRSMPEKRW